MSLGVFGLVRNEAQWIAFSILSMKDFVSEFVYFDGNSTDGTLELLDYIRSKYGLQIKVFKGMDPKNLKDDYVRMFNECLGQVKSDYAAFIHPDMICVKGPDRPFTELAYKVNMRSFGGDPHGEIVEITEGRSGKWKSIMKNDYGLHYHGHYGTSNEDLYFRDITGDQHEVYQALALLPNGHELNSPGRDGAHNENSSQEVYKEVVLFPYEVGESGIELYHYSDVRPYSRRLSRMITCIVNENPGFNREMAKELAITHPRVSLQPGGPFGNFKFKPIGDSPSVFTRYLPEIAGVLGKKEEELCWVLG